MSHETTIPRAMITIFVKLLSSDRSEQSSMSNKTLSAKSTTWIVIDSETNQNCHDHQTHCLTSFSDMSQVSCSLCCRCNEACAARLDWMKLLCVGFPCLSFESSFGLSFLYGALDKCFLFFEIFSSANPFLECYSCRELLLLVAFSLCSFFCLFLLLFLLKRPSSMNISFTWRVCLACE